MNYKIGITYAKESNKDKLIIIKELAWQCKSVAGKIQPYIQWEPIEGELDEILDYSVTLKHNDLGSLPSKFDRVHLEKTTAEAGKTSGFYLPIPEYETKDGLVVEVYVQFTIPPTRIIGWILSYATRGFTFEVTYPRDLGFLPFCFLNSIYEEKAIEEKVIEERTIEGKTLEAKKIYTVNSPNWYLPNEGIVLQLYPKT